VTADKYCAGGNPLDEKLFKFTQEHEWIWLEDGEVAFMGISDYAQSHLGDIVHVELPDPSIQFEQSKKMGEIESVKAVSDIFAPVSGHVIEINQKIVDEPGLINQSPYEDGWLAKLKLKSTKELDGLMNSRQYDEFVAKITEESSN
jgi:glycine cleavage system H protein